jgi:hypothetical protein
MAFQSMVVSRGRRGVPRSSVAESLEPPSIYIVLIEEYQDSAVVLRISCLETHPILVT